MGLRSKGGNRGDRNNPQCIDNKGELFAAQ